MMIEELRHLARQKKWTTLVLAAVPILMALVFAAAHFTPAAGSDSTMAYYMDEATGEVTVRPASSLAPLTGSTGQPTIVKAIYLTPSDAAHKFLAYLEKYDAPPSDKSTQSPVITPTLVGPHQAILVRLPKDGSPWIKADTVEGGQFFNKVYHLDSNTQPLRQCPP